MACPYPVKMPGLFRQPPPDPPVKEPARIRAGSGKIDPRSINLEEVLVFAWNLGSIQLDPITFAEFSLIIDSALDVVRGSD